MNERNLEFEWDENKAKLNERSHQVAFDEAESVFDDPNAFVNYDSAHSLEEHRFIIIGYSIHNRLLFVSYAERRTNFIRIISARKATPLERKRYEEAN